MIQKFSADSDTYQSIIFYSTIMDVENSVKI